MKAFLMVLLIVVVGFVCFVATRPSQFHVERSATIAAPSEVVFAHINDLHQWAAWSPWEKVDPQMTKTYSGSPAGVGAVYDWSGNDKVGQGRMTITESEPASKVGIRLEFLKPFKVTNAAALTLAPEGNETKVTWAMDGNNNFMFKAMGVFMNMDKMVGGDFERGLASLKGVAEAKAQSAASGAAAVDSAKAGTAK